MIVFDWTLEGRRSSAVFVRAGNDISGCGFRDGELSSFVLMIGFN